MRLTINLTVDDKHEDFIKDVLNLVGMRTLGNKFIEFLKIHTLKGLSNGEDYIQSQFNKILHSIAQIIAKNNDQIAQEVLEQMTRDTRWAENIINEERTD